MNSLSVFVDYKLVLRIAVAAGFVFAGVETADATTTVVPGTANPWLAGMPDGSVDSPDMAPFQSPTMLSGVDLSPGQTLAFKVVGAVANCFAAPGGSCCPTCGIAFPSPDGAPPGQDGAEFFHHATVNGMSDVVAPINSLIGIFLRPERPDLGGPPPILDFSAIGLSFSSLSPELKQPFFIGDGLAGTGRGDVQHFIVPEGATRLFLGTMDGAEWINNAGEFNVSLVPEPSKTLLLLLGFALVGGYSLRRSGRFGSSPTDSDTA